VHVVAEGDRNSPWLPLQHTQTVIHQVSPDTTMRVRVRRTLPSE
jgi:hypothetical protein